MPAEWVNTKRKKRLVSVLLICALVTMGIVLVLPSSAPEVKAVDHFLTGAEQEDGDPKFDNDGYPGQKNNVVVWHGNVDHIISNSYTVEDFMTLIIPPLNYVDDRMTQNEITFNVTGGGNRLNIYGKLVTQSDGDPNTKTAFFGLEFSPMPWDGIYLYPTSESVFQDVLIDGSSAGIYFQPGAKLMAPGIDQVIIHNTYGYGIRMDGARNYTNMNDVTIYDEHETANLLTISNGAVNITNSKFYYHGYNYPMAQITNAEVYMVSTDFTGSHTEEANLLLIEDGSNGTVLSNCAFSNGATGYHHVRVDGSTPIFDNCSFFNTNGERSVVANENATGVPAHPILLQPVGDGEAGFWDDSFDNTTMNATGSSTITLQWLLNVFAKDLDGNPIPNTPVYVMDQYANPAQPHCKFTDATGWAKWFKCTELILTSTSMTNFNPFNITAENNSMIGYAMGTMNMCKEINVTVPFYPILNTLPIVSWLPTPGGIQSGDVPIEFMLSDPDSSDDGNLSADIAYSTDGSKWYTATPASGYSNPIYNLNNNTLYYFMWDSLADIGQIYNETVYIRIIPSDRTGLGTPRTTGNFTVDNTLSPPSPPTGLMATLMNGGKDIKLSWNSSSDDGRGDNDVVGYTVYKSSSGVNGSYEFAFWIYATGSPTYDWVEVGAGYGDWNDYFYIVRANDTLGNEEQNTNKVGKFVNYLEDSWNLISVPLIQANSSIEYVLQTIEGNYTTIWGYHAGKSSPWLHWHYTKPNFFNDLIEINHREGYYIDLLNPDHLVVAGKVPTITQIPLKAGWNLVGYPCLINKTRDDALSSIAGKYNIVEYYDTVIDKELRLGPNDLMQPGLGYWIQATMDCIWEL